MLSLFLINISWVFYAFPISLVWNVLLNLIKGKKGRLEDYWLITLVVFGVVTCLVTFSVGNTGICVALNEANAE